jgi:hypothetical protein
MIHDVLMLRAASDRQEREERGGGFSILLGGEIRREVNQRRKARGGKWEKFGGEERRQSR